MTQEDGFSVDISGDMEICFGFYTIFDNSLGVDEFNNPTLEIHSEQSCNDNFIQKLNLFVEKYKDKDKKIIAFQKKIYANEK